VPAKSSGGQIFRAELPGNLVGNVAYRFASSDFYGNTGRSAPVFFKGGSGHTLRDLDSPLDAPAVPDVLGVEFGRGTRGSRGVPELDVLTVVYPDAPVYLLGSNAAPNTPFVALITTASARRRVGNLARMNVGGTVLVRRVGTTDAAGRALIVGGHTPADLPSGVELFVQFAVLDGVEDRWAVSRGVRLTSQ